MPAALLGRKIGITRFYTNDGKNIPIVRVDSIASGPIITGFGLCVDQHDRRWSPLVTVSVERLL